MMMMQFYFKIFSKPWAGLGLVALAGFCGYMVGYWIGARNTPVKTIDRIVEVQKETQVIEKKIDLEEIKTYLTKMAQDIKKDVSVRKTTTIMPDGTKVITEDKTDRSSQKTSSETTQSENKKQTEEAKIWKETLKIEERVKIIEKIKAPDWVFGVMAGASFNAPKLTLNSNGVTISAFAERRIWHWVYVQGAVSTRADITLSLRFAF